MLQIASSDGVPPWAGARGSHAREVGLASQAPPSTPAEDDAQDASLEAIAEESGLEGGLPSSAAQHPPAASQTSDSHAPLPASSTAGSSASIGSECGSLLVRGDSAQSLHHHPQWPGKLRQLVSSFSKGRRLSEELELPHRHRQDSSEEAQDEEAALLQNQDGADAQQWHKDGVISQGVRSEGQASEEAEVFREASLAKVARLGPDDSPDRPWWKDRQVSSSSV